MNLPYRGRFAPSPTGALHFGSLIAAVGSYLQARTCHGTWLVRIEDLDPPREAEGAAEQILRSLEAFSFCWDDEISYQSQRAEYYLAALEALSRLDLSYHCGCSRKELQGLNIYPGNCRDGLPPGKQPRAVRVRVESTAISFEDQLQGNIRQQLQKSTGDFIVRRADGLFAYQLAVVVDDAEQGITEIVRGSDLLEVTPGQIYLQQALDLPTPRYAHLPIALNAAGEKLSKQTFARPLDDRNPAPQLWQALRFLGHPPPEELRHDSIDMLWSWAMNNWSLAKVPGTRGMVITDDLHQI